MLRKKKITINDTGIAFLESNLYKKQICVFRVFNIP